MAGDGVVLSSRSSSNSSGKPPRSPGGGGTKRQRIQRPDGYSERRDRKVHDDDGDDDYDTGDADAAAGPASFSDPVKSFKRVSAKPTTTSITKGKHDSKTTKGNGKSPKSARNGNSSSSSMKMPVVGKKGVGKTKNGLEEQTSISSSTVGTTKSFGSSQTDWSLKSPTSGYNSNSNNNNKKIDASVVVQHNGRTLSSTFLNMKDDFDYNEGDDDDDESGEDNTSRGRRNLSRGKQQHGDYNDHQGSSSSRMSADVAPSQPCRTPETSRHSRSQSKRSQSTSSASSVGNEKAESVLLPPKQKSSSSRSRSRSLAVSPSASSPRQKKNGKAKKGPLKKFKRKNAARDPSPTQNNNKHLSSTNHSNAASSFAPSFGSMSLEDISDEEDHHSDVDDGDDRGGRYGGTTLGGKHSPPEVVDGRLLSSSSSSSIQMAPVNHEPPSLLVASPTRSILRKLEEHENKYGKNGQKQKKENKETTPRRSIGNDVIQKHQHGSKPSPTKKTSGDSSYPPSDDKNDYDEVNKNSDGPINVRTRSVPLDLSNHMNESTSEFDGATTNSDNRNNNYEDQVVPLPSSPTGRTFGDDGNNDGVSNESSSGGEWSVSINSQDTDSDEESPDVSISSNEDEDDEEQDEVDDLRRDMTASSGEVEGESTIHSTMHSNGAWTHKFSDHIMENVSDHWIAPDEESSGELQNIVTSFRSAESDDLDESHNIVDAEDAEMVVGQHLSVCDDGSSTSSISDDDIIGSDDDEVSSTGRADEAPPPAPIAASMKDDKSRKKRLPLSSKWRSPMDFESEDEEEEKKEVDESLFPLPPAVAAAQGGRPRSGYDKDAEWYCGEDGEEVDPNASYCSDGSSVLSAFRKSPAKKSPVHVEQASAIPESEASIAFSALVGKEGSELPLTNSKKNEKSMGMSFLQQPEQSMKDDFMFKPSNLLGGSSRLPDDDEIDFLPVDELVESSLHAEEKKDDNSGRKNKIQKNEKAKKGPKASKKNVKEDDDAKAHHPRKMKQSKSKNPKSGTKTKNDKKKKKKKNRRDEEDDVDIESGYGKYAKAGAAGGAAAAYAAYDDYSNDTDSIDDINIEDYNTDDDGDGDDYIYHDGDDDEHDYYDDHIPVGRRDSVEDDYDDGYEDDRRRRTRTTRTTTRHRRRVVNDPDDKPTLLQQIFKYLPCIMFGFCIFVVIDIILVIVFLLARNDN
mmetsp:Transcript_9059/g.22922  ORF Transcript_9059/g.22922 Transcript_9059/m.22922 type:complete len:1189 (-) Transcript_9059:872-4438(-)